MRTIKSYLQYIFNTPAFDRHLSPGKWPIFKWQRTCHFNTLTIFQHLLLRRLYFSFTVESQRHFLERGNLSWHLRAITIAVIFNSQRLELLGRVSDSAIKASLRQNFEAKGIPAAPCFHCARTVFLFKQAWRHPAAGRAPGTL